jgi:hypothetical protein
VREPDDCREQHSWQTENGQQMGGGGEDTFHCRWVQRVWYLRPLRWPVSRENVR